MILPPDFSVNEFHSHTDDNKQHRGQTIAIMMAYTLVVFLL